MVAVVELVCISCFVQGSEPDKPCIHRREQPFEGEYVPVVWDCPKRVHEGRRCSECRDYQTKEASR